MNETFSVGKVLGSGFKIWAKNVVPFLFITIILYSPLLIWGISTVHVGKDEMGLDDLEAMVKFSRYSPGVVTLLNVFVSAALTYGVVMELQGQRASLGACIGSGFKRFLPALGVAILAALATFVGAMLLIIPGLVVLCTLYVATPASVIEKPGLRGALTRSTELTRGHRWGIFGLVIILGLIGFGATKLVEAVMLPKFDAKRIDETLRAIPRYLYVDMARAVVIGSIGAVMAAVAYYYLRSEKEGTSAQELAKVFE